jgi:hypothetical protein
VDLKYNKIYSDKTHLPFEYSVLPVCPPADKKHVLENLGEVLRGDRITKSPLKVLRCVFCLVLFLIPFFFFLFSFSVLDQHAHQH